nr:MAG TPA: hypothetical protein [Caudoviricetes sp.]
MSRTISGKFFEKMLDKNKKTCYNVLSKQKENKKCL